jgi:hypothetical protein
MRPLFAVVDAIAVGIAAGAVIAPRLRPGPIPCYAGRYTRPLKIRGSPLAMSAHSRREK